MTIPKPSIWRTARTLWSIGLVLKQMGLGLLVATLAVVWLRVPDASIAEVIASFLLGVVILGVAGAGESAMILRLCDRASTPRRLAAGTLLLLAGIALWLGSSVWILHAARSTDLWAGLLNSRLPHELRYFFSYSHIYVWLEWMKTAVIWIIAGILFLVAVAITSSARPFRAMRTAACSMTYWIVVLLGLTVSTVLSSAVFDWVPGHTLRVELISLLLRLILAVFVYAAVLSLVIATMAACVRSSEVPYATPGGTPEESHERTAGIP